MKHTSLEVGLSVTHDAHRDTKLESLSDKESAPSNCVINSENVHSKIAVEFWATINRSRKGANRMTLTYGLSSKNYLFQIYADFVYTTPSHLNYKRWRIQRPPLLVASVIFHVLLFESPLPDHILVTTISNLTIMSLKQAYYLHFIPSVSVLF